MQNIGSGFEKNWVSYKKIKVGATTYIYIFQGFDPRKISGRPEEFDIWVPIYWAPVCNSFIILSL